MRARSINDNGQIVGYAMNSSGDQFATLFDPTGQGNNINLNTLFGNESEAFSINNNSQIVGAAFTGPRHAGGELHATLFDPTGNNNNIDLNTLIDPNLDWILVEAFSINDNGWIVGYGFNPASDYPTGVRRAFLLTPIAEPVIEAEIDIDPDTINLKSKGKWITCYIWLPEEYDVADVNSHSVFLDFPELEIGAEWTWFDEEGQVVIAKFNRSDIQDILEAGEVELTVTGELADGTKFEGTDIIRVIYKGQTENYKAKP